MTVQVLEVQDAPSVSFVAGAGLWSDAAGAALALRVPGPRPLVGPPRARAAEPDDTVAAVAILSGGMLAFVVTSAVALVTQLGLP